MLNSRTLLLLVLAPAVGLPQAQPELAHILQRLNQLEDQNRALTEEVKALRTELSRLHPEVAVAAQPVQETPTLTLP